mgnify:CR=1 FL=1
MLKKLMWIGVFSLGLTGAVSAQTFWLNYITGDTQMSLPVSSEEKCTEAIFRYVQANSMGFISCDVEPLPNVIANDR